MHNHMIEFMVMIIFTEVFHRIKQLHVEYSIMNDNNVVKWNSG